MKKILLCSGFFIVAVMLMTLLDMAVGRKEPHHIRFIVDTAHILEGAAVVWFFLWISNQLPPHRPNRDDQ